MRTIARGHRTGYITTGAIRPERHSTVALLRRIMMMMGWTVICCIAIVGGGVGHSLAALEPFYSSEPAPMQPNAAAVAPMAAGVAAAASSSDGASLRCNRRLYTYRISQSDSAGRECWDHVSVWSCFGRCDSKEISDWKFPYKRSYHPVCVHAGRAKAVAYLRQCDANVEPETRRYEYMEAVECHCQTCSSWDTRCEAPNHVADESAVRVLALAGPSADDLDY